MNKNKRMNKPPEVPKNIDWNDDQMKKSLGSVERTKEQIVHVIHWNGKG